MRLPAAGLRVLCLALLLTCSAATLNGCALQIVRAGPHKSSLQHHLYSNVLGIPAPGSVCISYADVDSAIYAATTRITIVPPKEDWTPDDVGPVGEVLLEASRIIASKYRLSPLEVAHDLPLLDTTGTAAAAICPRYASPLKCIPGRYRRIDGLCNNLHHPTWGATRAVFTRFLPPDYSDGISNPRLALDGSELPNPRLVSSHIHKDDGFHDHAATVMMVAWGQFMDHDFTLTGMPLDPRTRNELEACCHLHPGQKNHYCMEIGIPKNDPFYRLFGFDCIDFIRGFPGVPQNCALGECWCCLRQTIQGSRDMCRLWPAPQSADTCILQGYWKGYDPKVNPGISASFSAAAFRFGHSLLPSSVERWSPSHKYIASKRLHDLIRQPYDMFRPGVMDEYIMGMANQPCQTMDDGITQEVTNHLFEEAHERFGLDLVAFNLQRGRDFGLPGYGAFRKFCGLDPHISFHDLAHHMTNYTTLMYSEIYKSVEDIDLWSAGVSERPLPGSMLGPIFSCLIATQMQRIRKGDRYWYELPDQPSSFTPKQLAAIKQASLARIICENSDHVKNIQLYPLVLQDPRLNPRMSCKSGLIRHIDLTPWIEAPIGPAPAPYPPATEIKVFSTAKSLHGPGPAISTVEQSFFYGYGLSH
ncbi:peroxidasin homolog [Portunus trituberculatus]|uniref:peroxidasin homolog n=1 Tax=Portunus trituberculatus TaxID=210409 RepID=UPI001E1CE439|nr:peroxidasin homolog [Portunus trituberculatus]